MPDRSAYGPFLYRVRAFMQVRGQQWEGICCCWPHWAMPSPALCLDLGPKGLVGSGNMQS